VSAPQGATAMKITNPTDGASVGAQSEVTGTSQNLPSGQTIWILLHPHNTQQYYPQDKTQMQNQTTVRTNGNWNTTVYFGIGNNSDRGVQFDIVAALANPEAQAKLNTYQMTSASEGSWKGLNATTMPNGLTFYDSITVTKT